MEYNGNTYIISNEPENIKECKLQDTISANTFKEVFGTDIIFDVKNKKAQTEICSII